MINRTINPATHNPQSAILFSGFVLAGVVTTMIGPLVPSLAVRWSLSDASAGFLFTVQFCGGLAGGAGSGWVAARLGEIRALAAGFACMTAGVLALALGDRWTGSLGVLAAGLGLGFVIPVTNLLVARLHAHRAAAALAGLNLAWGAGALLWPSAVVLAGPMTGARVALVVLSALLAATAARFAALDATAPHGSGPSDPASRRRPMRLALIGVFLLLYGGAETALGGWLAEHTRRLGAPAALWGFATAAFWGGLTAGRALLAAGVSIAHEDRAALSGLALATCSVSVLLSAGDGRLIALAAAGAGLGLAPAFPVTVAALARETPGRAGGPLIALGGLGGATLPWLIGVVSARTGSLEAGLRLLLGACVALLVLHALRVRARR